MEMKATVDIMRNSDGLVRQIADRGDHYMWEDGNYSCDCNRRGSFEGAGGDPDPDFGECSAGDAGTGEYSARIIVDGKVTYQDGRFTSDLATLVQSSIDALAERHGYHRQGWTADELAIDLVMSAPALDGRDPQGLVPAVESWLQNRRKG